MPTKYNILDLIKQGYTLQNDGSWAKQTPKTTQSKAKGSKVAVMKANEVRRESKPNMYIFDITPIGKPSFQKSDRWRTLNHSNPRMRQRPNVTRWIETKAKMLKIAKKQGFTMPDNGANIKFLLPMPESWSLKKKAEMVGAPHKQKPDLDNLMKFLGDSVCEEDGYIYHYTLSKFWAVNGQIIIVI